MNDCKYCGGNCPEQVDKNGEARAEFICDGYAGDIDGLYRHSTIATIFKGEYVQVDMVDETIELTVQNNVYSRSESRDLLIELSAACAVSKRASETYSEQMQDELEPIEEPLSSKAKLHDKIGVPASGSYKNHLPRLMKEIEDRAERNNKKNEDDSGVEVVGGMIVEVDDTPVNWTFDTTDNYLELEDE
tara:strand:+ start:821 stop:1387 length:567 start_codon:yes stop_codon:yes gene_type:complete